VPTYFDLGLRGSAESWRSLRRRRATRSGPAGRHVGAAETFQSALEQAEQQFASAAVVAYDSRALNLFYGLSQAERAIVAAASSGQWQLKGHGIGVVSLDVPDALALRLKPGPAGGSGNFLRVSSLLGSDVPDELTLGQVWPLLVETVLHERPGSPTPAPLFVTVHPETVPNSGVSVVTAQVELDNAYYPPGGRWWDVQEASLKEFLARYPQLGGWEPSLPNGSEVEWPRSPSTHLRLRWAGEELSGGPDALRERLTLYRGRQLAYPVLEGRQEVMRPLLAWHAVLFGLSMLTRYEPARWTRMIDVDHSPQATVIEYVLDLALDAVPDLVDEAIRTVS